MSRCIRVEFAAEQQRPQTFTNTGPPLCHVTTPDQWAVGWLRLIPNTTCVFCLKFLSHPRTQNHPPLSPSATTCQALVLTPKSLSQRGMGGRDILVTFFPCAQTVVQNLVFHFPCLSQRPPLPMTSSLPPGSPSGVSAWAEVGRDGILSGPRRVSRHRAGPGCGANSRRAALDPPTEGPQPAGSSPLSSVPQATRPAGRRAVDGKRRQEIRAHGVA